MYILSCWGRLDHIYILPFTSHVLYKMGSGFPPTSGQQIPPTSGALHWPNSDPHMVYINVCHLMKKYTKSLIPGSCIVQASRGALTKKHSNHVLRVPIRP